MILNYYFFISIQLNHYIFFFLSIKVYGSVRYTISSLGKTDPNSRGSYIWELILPYLLNKWHLCIFGEIL